MPGYGIALALSFFVPDIYTAIAFDSGGVASGPMTATFMLQFVMGASSALGGNILRDAFGVVALVAMMPLLSIQAVGFVYERRAKRAAVAPEHYGDFDIVELLGRMRHELCDLHHRAGAARRSSRTCAGELGLPLTVTLHGRGTAVQSMLDLLGIESNERRVVLTIADAEKTAALIAAQKRRLHIGVPGHGIVIAVPIKSVGGGNTVAYLNGGRSPKYTPDLSCAYELIIAIANEGGTDAVMNAARAARSQRRHGPSRQGDRRKGRTEILQHLHRGGEGGHSYCLCGGAEGRDHALHSAQGWAGQRRRRHRLLAPGLGRGGLRSAGGR